jgi:hypothetical protein
VGASSTSAQGSGERYHAACQRPSIPLQRKRTPGRCRTKGDGAARGIGVLACAGEAVTSNHASLLGEPGGRPWNELGAD